MKFALDYNHLYSLDVEKKGQEWAVRLDFPEGTFPTLYRKLQDVVKVEDAHGETHPFFASDEMHIKGGDSLRVTVGGHDFGTITETAGELKGEHRDYLTVTETRLMGELPVGNGRRRSRFGEQRQEVYKLNPGGIFRSRGDGRAEGAIISDFHTHSSSEISGQQLVGLALKHDMRYPVRLLNQLGIDTQTLESEPIKRIRFSALEPPSMEIPEFESGVLLQDLSPADRHRLAAAMNMPSDRQSTAGAFDLTCYPYRYPLTKHPVSMEESYRSVAHNYAKNEVKHAEITITSPVTGELLTMLHRILPEIEQETGVALRLLIGVPRTLSREEFHASLEKAKILSQSPYVLGVDIIGYEGNKSLEFDKELRAFAAWTKEHAPEFTLRAHAGENAKNPENIEHILQIAADTGVRIRVGHAIYGVGEKTLKLAEQLAKNGQLVLEFNPDSNIALNNIDSLESIPFRECVARRIPFVIGSDGSGFYQTSARQLEKDLEHLELDTHAIEFLKDSQKELIARQKAYHDAKEAAVEKTYPGFLSNEESRISFAQKLAEESAKIKAEPAAKKEETGISLPKEMLSLEESNMPESLQGRHPVLLVGASGSSWARIPRAEQKEAAIAVDMLAHALDPVKVYFVTGRIKKEGLADVLYTTNAGLEEEKQRKFDVGALYEKNFLVLPGRMAAFANANGGEMIAIGGAAFTRDTILEAKHNNILNDANHPHYTEKEKTHFYVMENISGASMEKAPGLTDKYRATDAKALLSMMMRERQDWFRPELVSHGHDKGAVQRLYKDSQRRVESRERQGSFGKTVRQAEAATQLSL